MIKHIFCALIGTLIFFVARTQHIVSPSGPPELQRQTNSINISVPLFQKEKKYALPRTGEVTGWLEEKMIYKGRVKDHRLNGLWESWYSNGSHLDSGVLVYGIPDGEWKVWDSTGQLLAIRHYDADKLKKVKEEMRLDHPKNSFFPLTQLYKKDQQSAKRYLQPGYSFSYTEKARENSLDQVVGQNINGNPGYQAVFDECLHHGMYKNNFSNGMLRDSGYYKDGLKEGLWIHRNSPAGSWFTGAYKNGMRQYEWKQYDADGRLTMLIFYNRMGEEERRKEMAR